ncbi:MULTISPECIES: hypothetical protein [Acidiphilium]|uniref:Uncharacterized protein n=1 Tax=Acidiphilium rubrum TaxID=526 RepID=A0A8G2CJ83_ACIRU|nr:MULTISPECIES: hypothetical protein [Acidiphilium]SIQ46580.1 hypothetical protein SAMN05421828_10530 [Acidiphilium rubrum]
MTNETFIVAARRTVQAEGRTFGPGDEIQLPPADAAQMLAAGFVHRPGEAVTYPVQINMRPLEGNPAGIGHIGPVR